MHHSRQFRVIAALMALLGMLFMQLAVASYVCPIPPSASASAAATAGGMRDATAALSAMPGCVDMETAPPTLCHAHEQAGNQSLDRPDLPQVQPYVGIGLAFRVVAAPAPTPDSIIGASNVADLRANAPPISIRNCCFRI